MAAAHLRGPVVSVETRRGCTNKLWLSSEREARQHIRHTKGRVPLRPYKCHRCDGWHLTSDGAWKGSDVTT